jgi:hypothetical protein
LGSPEYHSPALDRFTQGWNYSGFTSRENRERIEGFIVSVGLVDDKLLVRANVVATLRVDAIDVDAARALFETVFVVLDVGKRQGGKNDDQEETNGEDGDKEASSVGLIFWHREDLVEEERRAGILFEMQAKSVL